jgi:hypothetical protein
MQPTTHKDIVGDTSAWRRAHWKAILKQVSPARLSAAKSIAKARGITLFDALEHAVGEPRITTPRKAPKRAVLPPPRVGDPRPAARPARAPRLTREEAEAGWLRHIRPGSPITR